MKRIMEATPVWLVGTLLFLAGIGIGVFVTPSSGSERAVFVEDGPLYDGQKNYLANLSRRSWGVTRKVAGTFIRKTRST